MPKCCLPAETPATFTDTVMNKVNIAAYQARIALYKGDYANAITYATEGDQFQCKTIGYRC